MIPKILDCVPVSSYGSCLVVENAFIKPLGDSDSPSHLSGGLVFGPEFPEWTSKFRHIHFLGPSGEIAYADSISDPRDHEVSPSSLPIFDDEFIYLGAFYDHFGHFMAECVHRLYIALEFNKNRGSKFCLVLWPNHKDDLNSFQVQALEWMGIDPEDVMIVREDCIFRRLLVPSQVSCLGFGDSDPAYINFLTKVTSGNLDSGVQSLSKTVFVSRSPYVSTGGTLGESFMDEFFEGHGSIVLRPEKLSLKDQIQAYLSTDRLVFSEGSAVHGLELVGRIEARGYMLGRGRPNASKTISKLGEARFDSWFNDQSQKTLPSLYPLSGSNAENVNKGPSLYRIYDTLDNLSSQGLIPVKAVDEFIRGAKSRKRLKDAADADLGRYISEYHYDHFERIISGETPQDFYYRKLRELIRAYGDHWSNE